MEMTVFLLPFLFVGGICQRKDETELLKRFIDALADINQEDNFRNSAERSIQGYVSTSLNDRKIQQKNGVLGESFETKQTSKDRSEHGYNDKLPNYLSNDEVGHGDLHSAIDAFMKAKRARILPRWLQHSGYRGRGTTITIATTTTWCGWWFWRYRC